MAELVRLFKKKDCQKELLEFCLVTGPSSMYPDDIKVEPEEIRMEAQWDTGASYTVISKKIVEVLGLIPTGIKMNVIGTNGVYQSNTYTVNLYLPGGIVFKDLIVAEMNEYFGASVLIGLDVILRSDFRIEPNEDNILLKFRYPPEGDKPFTVKPVSLFQDEE